jgi:hypothetical protein
MFSPTATATPKHSHQHHISTSLSSKNNLKTQKARKKKNKVYAEISQFGICGNLCTIGRETNNPQRAHTPHPISSGGHF